MNNFDTWEQASEFAWARAGQTGLDQGIHYEPFAKVWVVTFLPSPERTFGTEATWERVHAQRVRDNVPT